MKNNVWNNLLFSLPIYEVKNVDFFLFWHLMLLYKDKIKEYITYLQMNRVNNIFKFYSIITRIFDQYWLQADVSISIVICNTYQFLMDKFHSLICYVAISNRPIF